MPIPYFDAHCDTITKFRSLRKSEKNHIDMERLGRYSPAAQVMALWAPPGFDGNVMFRRMMTFFEQEMHRCADLAVLCRSADDLDAAAAEGNERAALALDMFHYWVAKVAGSYVAAMNGVDAIIFTAGVGENSKASRKAIAEYFGYLGVTIDDEANSKRGEDVMISTPDSKVKVFVIPTNEELVIARDTKDIVG